MSDEGDNVVDLSELENFSFQPKWERQKTDDFSRPYTKNDKKSFNRPKHAAGGGGFKKNPWQPKTEGRNFSQNGTRFRGTNRSNWSGQGRGALRPQAFRPFDPIVDIELYPNDAVFDAIVSAIKSTCKTYELFSVAKLFLEKPERFAMVVKKKDTQEDKYLYLTIDDNFIFETENAAIDHVFENYAEKYFDVEERDVQPPAGKFICLHKCGMTGKVLCPPNYHRYQEILLDHHDRFLPRVPFEKFKARIEKITSEEEIENWKIASSKIRIFTPKNPDSSIEKVELQSEKEAKKYFIENLKSQLITQFDSVRVSGETFGKMPRSLLSKSIFVLIEREKSFPLNFSNNLRGRLRRSGFTIYKLGKLGISYVSGIRRKFRDTSVIFADDIQKIIAIIDANPRISITSLCLQYMQGGVEISTDGLDGTVDQALVSTSQELSIDTENSTAPASDPKESVDRAFFKNLHWLIREGYVVEFEDGTLVSTEIIEQKKQPETKTEIGQEIVAEAIGNNADQEKIS
ncbi:MAG: hypothetical protein LBQ23_01265 [Puniceicoccales bacterium]|jgi:hypothetical protein|nr:hypothetical protein [Puniceicoccales bacterium]